MLSDLGMLLDPESSFGCTRSLGGGGKFMMRGVSDVPHERCHPINPFAFGSHSREFESSALHGGNPWGNSLMSRGPLLAVTR